MKKVFRMFTLRCLKENRTRTLITIVGIILSMSMFTAVIEGAVSGMSYLQNCEKDQNGSWNVFYHYAEEKDIENIRNSSDITNSVVVNHVGWADVSDFSDWGKYIYILSVEESFTELAKVNLKYGRMPQKETEIAVPEEFLYLRDKSFAVGDKLILNVGDRELNGSCLEMNNRYEEEETLVNLNRREYTIVGIYGGLSSDFIPRDIPASIVFTGGVETKSKGCVFSVKNPRKTYEITSELMLNGDKCYHSELIRYYGVSGRASINRIIVGLAIILVFLISFGSISLIYNSFSISVSERTKLFGILKSIGATRKQIRYSVRYEAIVLACIGIPIGMLVGCLGIGITLWCLRDAFRGFVGSEAGTQMKLVINVWALLISAAVCLITTLISARIPAKRAIKVSPIEAIRQTNDVKISAKEVKASSLVTGLFGFEGMMAVKNFKRNRKRYRSVVISLFLSLTLFISASSFCAYITDSIGTMTANDTGADIVYYIQKDMTIEGFEKLSNQLSQVEGVKKSNRSIYRNMDSDIDLKDASSGYLDFIKKKDSEFTDSSRHVSIRFYALDDAAFNRICEINGVNSSLYYDRQNPLALFYNRSREYYRTVNGDYRMSDTTIFDEKAAPITLECKYSQPMTDDSTERESVTKVLTIAALVEKLEDGIDIHAAAIIYPMSMLDVVFPDVPELITDLFALELSFVTDDHATVYKEMQEVLRNNNAMSAGLYDRAASEDENRMMVLAVNVFSYGFIILISLIAAANVFNTIATSISLRRREFAMLKSIGLGEKSFRRMMRLECVIFGAKGILLGLPASVAVTYCIYRVVKGTFDISFYIPWYSVVIAVGSVFAVVFATMLYATGKLKKENMIDTLKNENV